MWLSCSVPLRLIFFIVGNYKNCSWWVIISYLVVISFLSSYHAREIPLISRPN